MLKYKSSYKSIVETLVGLAILICSSASTASISCEKIFRSQFLPLSMQTEFLTVGDLREKNSIRIRSFSELKRVYGENYYLFAEKFYSDRNSKLNIGVEFLDRIKEVNPNFQELIYHPGVVTKAKEFFKFIKGKEDLSSAKALNLFSQFLGKKIYYRALSVPESSIDQISKGNLTSHGLSRVSSSLSHFELNRLNLFEDLSEHFYGFNSLSVLSISKYPEVAIGVGEMIKKFDKKKEVYLFTIEVPVLDVIQYDFLDDRQVNVFKNGTKIMSYPKNGNVEEFLLFGINKSEIVNIQRVSDFGYTFEFLPHKDLISHKSFYLELLKAQDIDLSKLLETVISSSGPLLLSAIPVALTYVDENGSGGMVRIKMEIKIKDRKNVLNDRELGKIKDRILDEVRFVFSGRITSVP